MKTIQLRRYVLVDGTYDEFIAWWNEWMPRARPEAGFAIEFAYGVRETNEFVWAVSAPGDRAAFEALDAAWAASEARAAAFAGQPQRIASVDNTIIEDTTPGA
ncbi:hypothetical protein ET445_16250 [Agromyces protaetiae]|uniref:NIPSNAP family containing protein n=1 Tax=Agromyces protaetiae TaxID=2509455 RepID=A0A4V0YHG7_9MICO|nr:hypothetical protein [Agromyces protaetiae]QAY74651.1 hypothetical protein ET445_16250 [Agromyces protaetiae]